MGDRASPIFLRRMLRTTNAVDMIIECFLKCFVINDFSVRNGGAGEMSLQRICPLRFVGAKIGSRLGRDGGSKRLAEVRRG